MLEEDIFQVGNSENEHSSNEGGRCGICMDIIIDRGVLDCCQHWFCFACIDNWCTITNLCPLCQSEFQLITCVPVYDTIGSNNVDEDSLSRDNDWFIEGKSNTLSFPSYYIDENAVSCLDGDGCKIRSGSTMEGVPDFDTSIACDSCDLWYHAFCVGFDPEGTSEDTWLCPRCTVEVPQNSAANLIKCENNKSDPESVTGECLVEAAFSGKVSVSVADSGETAVVVSMIGGNQWTEEPNEYFLAELEVDKGLRSETFHPDATGPKADSPLSERTNIQPVLEAQELELSLSHDTSLSLPSNSLGPSELKIGGADKKVNEQSCLDCVKSSSTNLINESESSIGLHLGLSVGSFLSVDDMNKNGTEDQITMNKNVAEDQITMNKNVAEDQITMNKIFAEDQITRDVQQQNPAGESLPKADKIEADAGEVASQIIGVKRKHTYCSDDASLSGDDEEMKAMVIEVSAKRTRAEGGTQMTPLKKEANPSSLVDSQKCPMSLADAEDDKSKCHPDKDDITSIMSMVKGTTGRLAKGLAHQNSAKFLKEKENVSGLRVKKIMKRAAEDKDSSELVQELRKEIREVVRSRSSKDIGENLFDPKLLAAFRAAIAGPKTEPVKKLSPLAVKVKKSMLEKGKVRENLTKKIYGNSNGRRRRAWDRDCEVEFWKYRCMRASKPEKIETLKSVLNLLRKNSESSDAEQVTECQSTNPILSRLYLADTSVFPRKDDIKPLSALKSSGNSDQIKEKAMSSEKASKLSLDNCASKVNEKGKFLSKVSSPLLDENGTRTNLSCSKSDGVSSKVHQNGRTKGPTVSPLSDSSINSKSGTTVKSDNVKMDKRKWALEILARKTATGGKSGMHEKQEDNAVLRGNYPLLAQLPVDMRPVLAPSRHNKIPISVRQTQLYRLTEHFMRKANLPVIRRTAETELAVADATNIEREVVDRSNSKLVYLNLCSQEIMHHSNNKRSARATESDSSSSSAVPVDESEQATDKLSHDPIIEEALRNAGLLSNSPPDSPHHPTEVQNKVGISLMEMKEEGPDNVFEMDSQPDVDIYGDFDYDLEDEDYIGASAVNVSKVQPEEVVSKMKVVFSTLNSDKSSNFVDLKVDGVWDVEKDSTCLLKSDTDASIRSSTAEGVTDTSSVPPESLPCKDGEDLCLAECEELYGPDKEPLVDEFPGESQKLYGLQDGEAPAENKCPGGASNVGTENQTENITVSTDNQNSSSREKSPSYYQKGDKILGKETTSNTDADKQSDTVNLVYKKVEAYVKEHIRPLCKSGVITAEQYRWAVAKTTDKVVKYHSNAKNANFLIKEGEKVKKLAEQYVEAARQKGKIDSLS